MVQNSDKGNGVIAIAEVNDLVPLNTKQGFPIDKKFTKIENWIKQYVTKHTQTNLQTNLQANLQTNLQTNLQ